MSSSDDLILTKLLPPVSGRRVIQRRRLLSPLSGERPPKLALVTAPAGFGKTTLMSQWYAALAAADVTPCWVSLDADDRDVRQFLSYIIRALRGIDSSIGADALDLLESQASIKAPRVIGRLVNDLVAEDRAVALFLDDYHSVDSAVIGQMVTTLLNLAPPRFHLIIGSRNSPGLPVASLRVRGDLRELSAADLRFDMEEADRFLREARSLDLARHQVAALQERTEGWAAGLQLAALSYGEGEMWDSFINSFRGSVRDVADYLAVDVLNRQRPELREFLLQTSVLDRLTAPLCEAVTGIAQAQKLLEEIEAQNLFVVPLDRERRWYRYHHLFTDFLRDQLARERPELMPQLYGRASQWFARENSAAEAVSYALKAEDFDRAAALVEEHALNMLWRGEMPRLDEWIRRLPDSDVARHPRLLLYQCWALFHMPQQDRAQLVLRRVEDAIAEQRAQGREIEGMTVEMVEQELRALRAGVAIARDHVDLAKSHTAGPTRASNRTMAWSAAAIANIHGYACLARSEFAEARSALAHARASHEAFGSAFGVVYADCFLGMVEMAEGRLHAAAALFQQAADVAGRGACQAWGTAVANVLRGAVLYEWNRLADAEALIAPYLALMDECGHVEAQIMGYCTMMKIKDVQGRRPEATSFFNHIVDICSRESFPRQRMQALHERVRSLVRNGDLDAAYDLADSEGLSLAAAPHCNGRDWDRVACLKDLIRARIALAEGEAERVLEFVAPGLAVARKVGRRLRMVELLLLTAEAEHRRNRHDEAAAALEEALSLADADHFTRVFLDHGPYLLPLLKKAAQKEGASRHRRTLVAAFDGAALPGVQREMNGAVLLEPLSVRERDVLTLMAGGKSNRFIAGELAITENTVKWHVKNIFQKLGVENRTAAVLAAQSMKLVRP